ncbi:MAG: MFS transporter [Clostridia bacterium]|nr:MFS transporter [Clostridia bacterium]
MKSKFRYRGSYLSYVVAYFSYFFAMGVVCNMLSIYLTDSLGKTEQEMSFILSASSLFGIITSPIAGYLNDKFKKPQLLAAISLIAAAVFSALFTAFKSTIMLYLMNGFIMGAISGMSPVSERVASSGKYRYGQIRIWGTIGFAAAPQVGGFILDLAEPYWLFIAMAVALLVGAVSYLLLEGIKFDEDPPADAGTDAKPRNRLSFLKLPMFLLFMLISMLYSGASGLNNAYAPLLLKDLGIPTTLAGTIISLSVLVELPIVLFSNKYMDRFSSKSLTALSLGLMLLQFIFYGFCKNVVIVVVSMVLLKAVCGTIFMMVMLKVIRGIVWEDSVSTAQGTMNSINSIAAIVIQNAGGWLATAMNIQALYIALSIITAIMLVLCLFLKIRSTKKIFS